MKRLDARVAGAIEQPHVRAWSTVMRVPTTLGDLWFKANVPAAAFEAAVVGLLARHRPDCVLEPLAVDSERGWMLMRDAGVRLRELVDQERDLGRWLDVLPEYAGLQIDFAPRVDELLAVGVPDRRTGMLAAQYERLLDEVGGLAVGELDRLHGLVPWVAELCDELGTYGVHETIQHDDLSDGQVFVRDGRYLFMDWADACVSHPFFSMSVALEGVIGWGLDDVERSEDITPYRDAYLGPFERYAGRAELERAHEIALRLGWVCRALNVQAFASSLASPEREELLAGVGARMRMFVSGRSGEPIC